MANLKTFSELNVWKKSHALVLSIYGLTKLFPAEEKFILVSQIKRAAISVPANIAEGFRRRSLRDSINFYRIADASLEELKYHLLLAHDLKYISNIHYESIMSQCEEASKMLNGWIKSQSNYLT